MAVPDGTSPDPVKTCGLCRWREDCTTHWQETDSLALVAGISRSQRNKLTAAGITTMARLGQCDTRVPTLAEATLSKLKCHLALN
ncbi:MAG: hypothetical protein EOR30_32045 [Mesorhizobium sp.]|nr:MAG: hypothetical protein EOR14_33225 [Mesorhizobium sp.]RWI37062.1 MAG: hypothetical protein EOR14_25970 [Mesorhizobium sp.]RWI62634.1 MAG: hypothetical protein EOR17_32130 [Mesorhizobium sp.]RWI81457.1 MAG: hypothetical protein EOR20_32545 [Mesorhizobium sp.]RWJ42384.1 MAG: hypothetical protein EOR30_32045 [Mesorhizobium sp.]